MSKAGKEKNKTTSKKETKAKKAQEDNKTPLKDKVIVQETQWEFIHSLAFWGLAVLLFLAPYFRGLFFAPEQERALIFAAVFFWLACLWKWRNRDCSFLSHPMDYFVLAFPFIYLISALQAVNYGLAVDEVVKTTLYFVIYWIVSRLVRNEKDISNILHVIYFSAIGVALAGLATATGIIHINDGFLERRIYSTFQYPNALASYLAAVIFIGLYLWHRTGQPDSEEIAGGAVLKGISKVLNINSIKNYLYAAGFFLLLTVFIGSKSKGAFIVFSVVFVLYMLGLPKGRRVPVFTNFLLAVIPSFISIWFFLSAAVSKHMGTAWLWIFAGLALVLAGQAFHGFIERKGLFQWIAAHRNIILAVVLLAVVSGCIGAGVYISGHSDSIKNLAEELRLRNATERMYFFQDAMKMFKERPIIGWGGGGWEEAYRAYQGYYYNSNEVHGHYFQIMVEVGIIGILVMLGIWASFLYACHRLYHGARENADKRFLVLTVTIAALSIGLHAVIDFDLSLSALALVLWTLFGIIRGVLIYSSPPAVKEKGKNFIQLNYPVLAAITAVPVLLVVFAGSLAIAGNYASEAGKYIQAKNASQSIEFLQKASAYNPFNAQYHATLALVYQATGKYDDGIEEANKALKLSKYSATRNAELAALYLNTKNNSEDAIRYAEKALALAPFQIQWYELLARTYFIVGYNEIASGNLAAAKQYFQKADLIPAGIQARMDGLNELEKRLWKDGPPLSATPEIKLNVGASQYILGIWPEAESNLKAASQSTEIKGEAMLWLSVLKSKQGKAQEAEDLLQQANKLVPQLAEGYGGLKNLPTLN